MRNNLANAEKDCPVTTLTLVRSKPSFRLFYLLWNYLECQPFAQREVYGQRRESRSKKGLGQPIRSFRFARLGAADKRCRLFIFFRPRRHFCKRELVTRPAALNKATTRNPEFFLPFVGPKGRSFAEKKTPHKVEAIEVNPTISTPRASRRRVK